MITKSNYAASSRLHENDVLPNAEGSEQSSGKDKKRMAEGEVMNRDSLQGAARIPLTPEQKGLHFIMEFTKWCIFVDLFPGERDVIDPHIYCISPDADECDPADWICFAVYYRDDELCAKTTLRNDGLLICRTYDRDGGWLMTPWNAYKPIPLSKGCEPFDNVSELYAVWKALRRHLDSVFPTGMIDLSKPAYAV